MAFKEGDFLEIEYTVSDAEDKKVLATTDQKRAKEAGILNEKMQYGPVVVVIGAPGVLKGLDRELRTRKRSRRLERAIASPRLQSLRLRTRSK